MWERLNKSANVIARHQALNDWWVHQIKIDINAHKILESLFHSVGVYMCVCSIGNWLQFVRKQFDSNSEPLLDYHHCISQSAVVQSIIEVSINTQTQLWFVQSIIAILNLTALVLSILYLIGCLPQIVFQVVLLILITT